jgi:2-dehydropantoate 2-reductase
MRLAMFGSGGVGGYFGARLVEAGEEVVFVARGDHLEALRGHGLRLESIAGDVHVDEVEATDDPAGVGPVDAVVVATKTWQLPDAARAMRPLVGPETTVLPVLNGVEAADVLTESLDRERVIGGLCGMISFLAGPGHIRHTGAAPWITFGELDGSISDRIRRLEEVFRRCRGVRVEVTEDIHAALWKKFMFITATGGVGSVTRAPVGVFRSVPETRAMLEEAMREVVAVARARGVSLTEDEVVERMAFIDGLEPHGTSSMQRDILEERRSELDAWNGTVVRLGRQSAVDTPVHSAIYASLLPQELRARGDLEFPEPP